MYLFKDTQPKLPDANLIVSYDGTIVDNQLIDCSGNARHATLYNSVSSEKTQFGNTARFFTIIYFILI